MDKNENIFTQVQAPEESSTVLKDSVTLQREWEFWENYEKPGSKLDWKDSIQSIFTFNDIISFWQFWNSYPGSEPSNIFYNGERMRL